jgi:hypothetical protein
MNNITMILQNNLKSMMVSWWTMYNECIDIGNTYWKTEVSTYISGKGANDPVTVNTKLNKTQFAVGMVFVEQIAKFFGNEAVSTGDYLASIDPIKYGNTSGATAVPASAESLGDRMYRVCLDALYLLQQAKIQESTYNNNSIGTAFASVPDSAVVFGADFTRSELISAIVLLQQWQRFITNQSVTTGDYESTLSKFFRI